ncbi:MAG: VOC family protein [Acidimicrobiales bacterium]
MSAIGLRSISLDCEDPAALGAFWAKLLGGEVAYESEGFVAVRLDRLWLSMAKIENYKAPTWPSDEVPKQIHFDLAVEDLEGSEAEALALGATKANFQPQPERWTVMIDPAGHPFCLTTQIP